jgi:hypothetical protein
MALPIPSKVTDLRGRTCGSLADSNLKKSMPGHGPFARHFWNRAKARPLAVTAVPLPNMVFCRI